MKNLHRSSASCRSYSLKVAFFSSLSGITTFCAIGTAALDQIRPAEQALRPALRTTWAV